MELRPRKGRSAQPPSTPSADQPSFRKPPQSASRKKPASVHSSPIFIPSDGEVTDPKHSQDSLVGLSPALVQDKPDSLPLAETPLSEFVSSLTQKALSSTIKQKKKAASHVKKKVTEGRPIAEQDTAAMKIACMINNTVPQEITCLDDTAKGNQNCAVKDADAAKTIAEDAYKDSIELDAEEPEGNCKNTLSAKKKSAAKSGRGGRREIAHEARDVKVDQLDVQEPDAPYIAVSDGCHQTLSLTVLDNESAQVSGELQVDLGLRKNSTSTSEEDVHAQDSQATSKKSRLNKENSSEERLSRKLFEENTELSADTEPNSIKEEETRMHSRKTEKSDKMVSIFSEARCSMPSTKSLQETAQLNIESFENEEKNLESTDAAISDEGIGSECTETLASDELTGKDSFSGNETGKEKGSGFDNALKVKHDKMKGVVMHIEDHNNADDYDDTNASSCSDEDEADLASIFASSLKAHLHISETSLFGNSMAMQSEQDVQGEENLCRKDAMKDSHLNGNNGRLAFSWSPKVALPTSKNRRPQQVGPSEARPSKIWEKDQCLLDGLCVPPADPVKLNKLARQQKKDTTGDKWYNLSAPTITPELKKELQLVKLRGVLDPKRHYKAEDSKGLPKYFQVGTVVGGPADFFSGRLMKKEQKNSLANELLSDTSLSGYRKRKYLEIQDQKQAGGKGFMKKKKSKRTPAWAKI